MHIQIRLHCTGSFRALLEEKTRHALECSYAAVSINTGKPTATSDKDRPLQTLNPMCLYRGGWTFRRLTTPRARLLPYCIDPRGTIHQCTACPAGPGLPYRPLQMPIITPHIDLLPTLQSSPPSPWNTYTYCYPSPLAPPTQT